METFTVNDSNNELSKIELDRIGDSTKLKRRLEKILASRVPSLTGDQLDSLSHDLTDLLDIMHHHADRIRHILELENSKEAQKLDEYLSDLLYGDITELEYHVNSLKTSLPGVLKLLSE